MPLTAAYPNRSCPLSTADNGAGFRHKLTRSAPSCRIGSSTTLAGKQLLPRRYKTITPVIAVIGEPMPTASDDSINGCCIRLLQNDLLLQRGRAEFLPLLRRRLRYKLHTQTMQYGSAALCSQRPFTLLLSASGRCGAVAPFVRAEGSGALNRLLVSINAILAMHIN